METKVFWDRRFKVHKAAAKENTRYAIDGVFVDEEHLVATDGRMLAAVPIAGKEDDCAANCGVVVGTDAILKAMEGKGGRSHKPAMLEINDKVNVYTGKGRITYDRHEGAFPPWREIVPKVGDGGQRVHIKFDPKRLAALAEAIGSPDSIALNVTVEEDEHGKFITRRAMLVENADGDKPGDNGAIGVLMPIARI